MPVRFIIGRSGTGKTANCVGAIVQMLRADPLGPPIFWLLPRQSTFMAERQLATETGLPAVCRVRVESFDGLARLVLADCGGAAIPQVTTTGRRLILSHLLRQLQPQLKFFAGVAHHPGLAATLDATFAEFERSGHAPQQVIEALEAQSVATETDDTLRPKLSDLHLLYEAYTQFLGQDRLDPHRRNEQVVACMGDAKLLRGATVFIDGFYDFTESERRMICGLATSCHSVDITVLADPSANVFRNADLLPDESSLFHRTEDAYRSLVIALRKSGAQFDKPVKLTTVHRFKSPDLSTIESSLFAPQAKSTTRPAAPLLDFGDNAVLFLEADDRPAEADAAARQVLRLLRSGHRMRDIAVLVRDLDAYQDLIDASFREHGIVFFLDRRRAAAHHPLLRLVRSAMTIATDGWPTSAIFSLVKTGLAGLSLADADDLENYALDHRIRATDWPSPEPWIFSRRLTRDEDNEQATAMAARAAQMDSMRRTIVDAMAPFVAAYRDGRTTSTVRAFATELYALLGRLNVASTIARWIADATHAQQFEQAAEHTQVWAEFVQLLDEIVDLLGDEPMTAGAFVDLLNLSLDAFDLALAPPTIDGVLVGQVDRTRLPEVRATLVLGLSDGQFPRTPREDSILSDRDRNTLRRGEVTLRGDGNRQLLDERLFGYVAFTASSESLYCSRIACDAATGKPLAASPYWTRLRELFPSAPLSHVGASTSHAADNPSLIATPRQLVVSLMRWARSPANNQPENATLAALYQWLVTHPADDSPVAHARFRAWGALGYQNRASLRPDIAAAMFTSPIEATVTRIETFAACPFKHFVQYGLRLQKRSDDAFSPLDLSRVYHDLIEGFVRGMIASKRDFRDLTTGWTDARITAAVHQVATELRKDLAMDAGRSRYLMSRIERTMRQLIDRQQTLAHRAALNSGHVGVSFGRDDSPIGPLTLTTKTGRQLNIRGRIDRIDILGDPSTDGSRRAAVFDYKLAGDHISAAAVYNGLSLQLLTYLLVLQANGHELAGTPLTPAAGFYVQVLRKLKLVAHPTDAQDPTTEQFLLSPKPRGIFDADCLDLLDPQFTGGTSDCFQVSRNKTGAFGRLETSDVCDADAFLGVLNYVRDKLIALADAMAGGDVNVAPYRLGKTSPCPRCAYRSVCRFDAAINGYHHLQGIGREEWLTQVRIKP
jgi:ATP-dependent helicase/nuclease subunit B